jgi:hypothetical protein
MFILALTPQRGFSPRVRDMAPDDYGTRDYTGSTLEQVGEQVGESAREAGRRAAGLTDDIADAIRERPYTALAITAGLAFAVGALWQLGQQHPRAPLASLLGNLPELPGRDSILPSRWR